MVEIACDFAKSFNAELELFHVIESVPSYVAYELTPVDYPPMDAYQSEVRLRANFKLKDLLTRIRAEVPTASAHLAYGSPLHELIDRIKTSGADFIILGTHGHGLLGAMLLGSVAEGMVRGLPSSCGSPRRSRSSGNGRSPGRAWPRSGSRSSG